jgi:hypothetical protein
MKKLTRLSAGLLFFFFAVTCSYGQIFSVKAFSAIPGNETRCDKTVENGNTHYSYPVMFEGHILDYADFTMKSQGQIALVTGKPGSADAVVVPFYVYLKRNGKVVTNDKMDFFNKPLTSIGLVDVLLFSKPGDVLIVVPAKQGVKTKIMLNDGC